MTKKRPAKRKPAKPRLVKRTARPAASKAAVIPDLIGLDDPIETPPAEMPIPCDDPIQSEPSTDPPRLTSDPPESVVLRCPACNGVLPTAPVVTTLVICPSCLRSVALDDAGPRLATALDTTDLSDTALAALRTARKRARQQQG